MKAACTTRTEYNTRVAVTITIAQFFNTCLLTFVIDVLLKDGNKYALIFRTGGLVYNIFYVFISNAFATPLVAYFDPASIMKKLMRWYIERKDR